MCRVVAYFRVSTEGQGRYGLGLEAQREAVAHLCQSRGWQIVAEFTEVESGKRDDRPQLQAALHRSKVTEATLVIAKVDRLSRSAAFLTALQESGTPFIAADMPEACETTVGILAVIAVPTARLSLGAPVRPWQLRREGRAWSNPNGTAALRTAAKGNLAALEAVRANAAERVTD